MGEVWRAYDTDTDRIVAIKLLPAHFSENEDFQRRFRREAHAAARLNSPHVIPIHNYGEIDGRLYVDMRLIEGRDLQAVLADGPMEPGRAVRLIEGVALALHAAHEVGLFHRDVKPSNILLDRNDFAYLIDFGIARALDETRLTSTGVGPGTVLYMAPERLGEHPDEDDARVDIYALACVLYECLTGRPPFSGSPASIIAAHLNTPPPQPSSTQQNVSGQFDEVIATGMAKDPDNRYATTVELADAARDAITVPIQRPTPSPAPNPPTQQAPATEPAAQQQPADLNLAPTQQRPPGWPPAPPARRADRPPPEMGTSPAQLWWRRHGQRVKVAVIAAFVVILAAAGITGYLLRPHSPASPTPTAQPAPPLGQSTDYTALLLKASDIGGSEPWKADPPTLNPDGQPGAEGVYTNESGTRAVDIIIQVWKDAPQARLALTGGKGSLPKVVTGTPQPADVGDGGTLVSGTKPDGSQALTVLLFTQGKAFVDMTVGSAPDDPAPPDNVIDLGRQQASNIESGLPA